MIPGRVIHNDCLKPCVFYDFSRNSNYTQGFLLFDRFFDLCYYPVDSVPISGGIEINRILKTGLRVSKKRITDKFTPVVSRKGGVNYNVYLFLAQLGQSN